MENQNNNEVVRDLALKSISTEVPVIAPDGSLRKVFLCHQEMREIDVSDLMAAPVYLEQSRRFSTVESFIAYFKRFQTDDVFITGSPDEFGEIFAAVLDYHGVDKPSFCRHKISLAVERSAQWKTWTQNQKTRFSQRDFKNFIEDNVEDIQKPDSAELIQQIALVKVGNDTAFESSVSDDSEHTADSNSKTLTTGAPGPLTLALKPWRCMANHMAIKARIYAHISESNRVEFSYQLINAEDALEKKFNDYRAQIKKETGTTVYV